ncbi:sigma-54-dependent Fis family transcriptional regulator [Anoxybacter fermentans]|uniref:Sigma-54-dependent Fis family transcriptional regulator n=1 Tax=Anoxybacter fermentans TaxID=1323375 RepID=A0A3Q9HSV2_9FIRM|nr:sigma-54 dependent transcriptional regulator PrdR [Anoxybacter fermentans]AZR74630.1 sigma-54-dependent Fis family transcriptional regulator [Anoxybacter fermentans]
MLSGQLNNSVKDIMNTDVLTVTADTILRDCIKLMLINNKGEILVIDEKRHLKGLLTFTDVARIMKEEKNGFDKSVKYYMRKDILTIGPNEKAIKAKNIMKNRGIGRLPVVKNKKLIGIIRIIDILDKIYSRIEEESASLALILNNLHEAVCVVNTEGIVVLWSKKSEKLYGVKAEQIVGNKLEDFFPNALLLKVLKDKKPIENIYHSPREGSYVIISAIPLFINGEFVGAVSTDRDVTEVTNLTLELEKTKDKLELLQEEVNKINEDKYSFGIILGKSKVIKEKIARARRVARTNSSVLITGESGTGKEVFARAIHQASGRKGPFVAVNCSAIPENLFESEMFGYVGGAFTGALKKGKVGKFELANGGTLFLDEIGDMPMYMQVKLLRVLQEKKIVRVGSEKDIDVDVRIISATHRDLRAMVKENLFREDLYYRLNVVSIELPALRERKEDIPILLRHFICEFCKENNISVPKLKPEVLAVLMSYSWKGNIRELKNTAEHLVVFSKNGEIRLDSVPEYILEQTIGEDDREPVFDLQKAVERTEKEIIRKVMKMVEGNKSKAAKLLNIPRSTLYYKLKYYNMKDLL